MTAYAPTAESAPDAGTPARATPLDAWIADAKARLARGELRPEDLEAVRGFAVSPGAKLRQRILYLHATTPNLGAGLVGAVVHEPVKGGMARVDPSLPELPYKSVHDALVDGWQIIHFPLQTAPFEDREIDILGYEFILQKMEPFDA
ncbi:MAG: hypothetical protein NTW19_06685 [Planctomycetota bacterium]|nr:hypothetical protein [Planctomycetota bacterium]